MWSSACTRPAFASPNADMFLRCLVNRKDHYFSGKTALFLHTAVAAVVPHMNAGGGGERVPDASQCLRTSTLFDPPLLNHRPLAQTIRATSLARVDLANCETDL
jgi:hypothetical protein